MAYLLGEILLGLLISALLGFWLGWALRGIRERIRRNRID
jgi:NhaP-type Na+/H+ or K+/H+ antiporter